MSVTMPVEVASLRQSVLASATRFKSTWIEFGKLLLEVKVQEKHQEWGYPSFEVYCSKELHIRKQTAFKLTRSYSFLAKHHPSELEGGQVEQKAPAFEVVEVLAEAEERGQLSPREYSQIRDSIWNEGRATAELKRELSQRYPRPVPTVPSRSLELGRLTDLAKKLADQLSKSSLVPASIAERARALSEDLQSLES